MDLRLLLDTSALIEAQRGKPEAVRFIEHADDVFIPFVALAEFRSGAYRSLDTQSNLHTIEMFLEQVNAPTLWPSEPSLDLWARLDSAVTRGGHPASANDLWIATLALQHGLTLLTKDKGFLRVPGLEVELLPS